MGKKKPTRFTASGLKIVLTGNGIRYKIGNKKAKGDIHASRGDVVKLTCDNPFAIFVGELADPAGATLKPHGWADDTTGAGTPALAEPANASTADPAGNGHFFDLTVDAGASDGSHKFSVVVFDDEGRLITDDPQIIVD